MTTIEQVRTYIAAVDSGRIKARPFDDMQGIARLAFAQDKQNQALTKQLQHEQTGREGLEWRYWLAGNDSGVSSESLMCAHHGTTPRNGWFEPADSDDFGRCYRLIRLFPQVRPAVDLLAQKHAGWAALAPIWDELTVIADGAGMQVRGKFSPQINRRIHEVRWPAFQPAALAQAEAAPGSEGQS